VISPPRIGGTYLYCPVCFPRGRVRTLRQYARHWARQHPLMLRNPSRVVITGPVQVYVAPAGAQATGAGWTSLGTLKDGIITGNVPWSIPNAQVLRDAIQGLRSL